jgi:hypothetical protein
MQHFSISRGAPGCPRIVFSLTLSTMRGQFR